MKFFFSSILLLLINVSCISQGAVVLQEEPAITALMDRFIHKNKTEETVKAYRIQIIATSDRRKMESARYKFEKYFPTMESEWQHEPPYYRVIAGAWRTKIEVDAYLLKMKEHFPAATPIIANIDKMDLL